MRKNHTLAVAITTALAIGSSVGSYAQPQFANVNSKNADLNAIGPLFSPFCVNQDALSCPEEGFDFVGKTVVQVPEGGVTLATELFGGGTLVVPTSSGSTGNYMAVVYTIDGTINRDFIATFTLDKGKFAEAPMLGVRSNRAAGGNTTTGVVTPLTSGLGCIVSTMSTMLPGQVFRFDPAISDTNLPYQVAKNDSAGVVFWQLGNPYQCPTVAVPSGTKIFTSTDFDSPATSKALTRILVNQEVGTAPGVDLSPSTFTGASIVLGAGIKASSFTPGWNYICGTATDSALDKDVFKVNSTTQVGGLDALLITILPSTQVGKGGTSGGFNDVASGGCANAVPPLYVTHVNVSGDTILSFSNVSNFAKGNVYRFDRLGTSNALAAATMPTGAQTIGHTTTYTVTNTDTTKNTITISPALAIKALLHGELAYDMSSISTGGDWSTSNPTSGVVITAAGAANNSVASFTLKAGTTNPTNLTLYSNDQLMMLYKLTDLGALATTGETVKMTAEMRMPTLGVMVNPTRQITVAKSAQAVTGNIVPLAPTVLISVSSKSTQFSGEGEAFVNAYAANIGKLTLKDARGMSTDIPMKEDAVNPFSIGTNVLASGSVLTVTYGQFSASQALPGKVFVKGVSPGGAEISADQVTTDVDGNWTAIWNLDSTDLNTILADAKGAYIGMRVDGNTSINSNTNDQNPHAKLDLDFDNTAYQDKSVEGDLLRIAKDGTTCIIYVVPPHNPDVPADVLNIRITNDSSIADIPKGTMYDVDGNVLFAGQDLFETPLGPGATAYLTNEKLNQFVEDAGNKWPTDDGKRRTMLRIESTISKLEVLALVRQRNAAGGAIGPLSNLSVGATGTSCKEDP